MSRKPKLRESTATLEETYVAGKGLLTEKTWTQAERDTAVAAGHAKADSSFPINTAQDVVNAVHDWGRAGATASDKAHIVAQAKRIGATDKLPADWAGSTATKEAVGSGSLPQLQIGQQTPHEVAKGGQPGSCQCQECQALRESIPPDPSATVDPDDDGDLDGGDIDEGQTTEGQGTDAQALAELSEQGRFTEAASGSYEVTLIQAGMGNARDRRVYTKAVLQDAVNRKLFEGLRCYADHPTASEEKERPERSVKELVGFYSGARVVETSVGASVSATFTPVQGPTGQWVRDLIDTSLGAPSPIVGISINGNGDLEEVNWTDGRPANQVTKILTLDSADLITRPGAGGNFRRKLTESLRRLPTLAKTQVDREVHMKPEEQILAATKVLREEASTDEQRLDALELIETAGKAVEAASLAAAEAAAKITESAKITETSKTELETVKAKLAESEAKVSGYEQAALVAKVISESDLPESLIESTHTQLMGMTGEETMKAHIAHIQAIREDVLSEVRMPMGTPARTRETSATHDPLDAFAVVD
jgi:hypothetical protein